MQAGIKRADAGGITPDAVLALPKTSAIEWETSVMKPWVTAVR